MVENTHGARLGDDTPQSDYSLVFNTTSDYMLLIRVEPQNVFRVVLANEAYVAGLRQVDANVTRGHLEGLAAAEFAAEVAIPEQTYRTIIEQYTIAVRTKSPVVVEECVELKGRPFYLQSSYTPVIDESGNCTHVLYVGRDITNQKKVEHELRTLLAEREVLIKELFHRTKNNMSVISSLFSIYAADATPDETPIIISDISEKIQAMSSVHGRLYQSSDLDHLVLSDVLQDVAAIVEDEGPVVPRPVAITFANDTQISIDVALPLSMVLQQILSTALRLPVAAGQTGKVDVAVQCDADTIQVDVQCDTLSTLETRDLRQRTGRFMIREIVSRQLHGELQEPDPTAPPPARWRLRLPREDSDRYHAAAQ